MQPDLVCFVDAVDWSSGPHAYAELLSAVPSPQPRSSNAYHFHICDTESSMCFAV